MLRPIVYTVQRYLLGRRHLTANVEAVGLKLRFTAADAMGRHLYKYGRYEPELTGLLMRSLRLEPGDVFLDVGANIGWYSLLLGRHQPPGVRIYAFEPAPDTFALLTHNIGLNGLSQIEARRLAVSDENSKKTLFRYSDKNTGRHSLLPINEGGEDEVETTTLSDFCRVEGIEPSRIRLVKIDVEGYEPFVLRGMGEVLRTIPAILAEYSPRYMRRGGVEPAEYLDLMFSAGFVPHRVEADALLRLDRSALDTSESNDTFLWRNTHERDRWPFDASLSP